MCRRFLNVNKSKASTNKSLPCLNSARSQEFDLDLSEDINWVQTILSALPKPEQFKTAFSWGWQKDLQMQFILSLSK